MPLDNDEDWQGIFSLSLSTGLMNKLRTRIWIWWFALSLWCVVSLFLTSFWTLGMVVGAGLLPLGLFSVIRLIKSSLRANKTGASPAPLTEPRKPPSRWGCLLELVLLVAVL